MPPLVSPLLLIAIHLFSLAPESALGAVTTQAHRQDLRNLPSPLPGSRARNQAIMKIELSPMKRTVGADLLANPTSRSTQKKRFKTSGSHQSIAASSSNVAIESSNSSRTRDSWRSANDLNNNSISIQSDHNNNNDSNNNPAQPVWRRNIDSINGTVDISQYERNDIDRLYGDALLVYFKNFNESLPSRRELISINGTISSAPVGSGNRIPIYRSVPTNEPQ